VASLLTVDRRDSPQLVQDVLLAFRRLEILLEPVGGRDLQSGLSHAARQIRGDGSEAVVYYQIVVPASELGRGGLATDGAGSANKGVAVDRRHARHISRLTD